LPIEKVKKFEEDLYTTLDEEKNILKSISKEKTLIDETEQKLVSLIEKVTNMYK
jgi:hypothetical protein